MLRAREGGSGRRPHQKDESSAEDAEGLATWGKGFPGRGSSIWKRPYCKSMPDTCKKQDMPQERWNKVRKKEGRRTRGQEDDRRLDHIVSFRISDDSGKRLGEAY